ncbi:tyrosine-type recombinase/integrase [Mesorhizobium sp. NZP2077]|uniref:tyrosine-type recombinase/integrase n=1 Tax=Mesorhizobium sp. NZP2077 TaxID=2483404 RepID=UPI001FEE0CBE|nr:tyrosine-type recombinase/integrase [Mesorhizobium sp. NZP2077]
MDRRTEVIRVPHSKTQACSLLPLKDPVGEAVLAYLRSGRPATDARESSSAGPRALSQAREAIQSVPTAAPRCRHQAARQCGPHIFRHASAVEMLRASIPQKVIGDLLGHRSTASTVPYLELVSEDLRDIALDVPGAEVLA